MANINRVGSPMDLCEENYDQKQEKIERQKKLLASKQRTKSPFFIGSIEEVNKKISKLDRKLQHYTQLVVESRASDYDDMDAQSETSARGRDRSEKRERETRELNKFAGYFTMKQSFLPGRSERVRNISKVSMQPSKTSVLYQYGGYDNTELTALPEDIPFKDMLKKAANAHMYLYKKEYPCLISQAVYAAYCHGFPDSYKHFGEEFKEDLITLAYSWIAGITPAPRSWLTWNFDKLEPENIKLREEIAANTQKNKKSSANLNLDYLDSIFSSNASQYTSTTSLNQSMSKSSMQSKSRGRRLGRKPSISQSPVSSKLRVQSAESSTDSTIIDYIADSQKSTGGQGSARKGQGSGSKQRPVDARKLYEALTPIRETTMEEDHEMMSEHKPSNVSVTLTKAHSRVPERKQTESHPACKGPDFVRTVFNISGRSPLVAHYFRMKNISDHGGQDVLIQRTEICNLPPYP
ncbi:hypothetical protein KUTeg_004229 [Tegillarca granosa]|uniref:Uncharacterized protein n=1 Tax=Tegillarca granosa TaxID=220873 RepID=A0ABQ9FTV6_TEGGR|nr:hypothetical protein KUTeg_003090 [Tegillarca granosa]KAJ8319138.1 hypothetical protein KUTeg_004229 [Tegillarca granosa]